MSDQYPSQPDPSDAAPGYDPPATSGEGSPGTTPGYTPPPASEPPAYTPPPAGGYEPPAYTPPPAGGYEPPAYTPPPAGGYEPQAPTPPPAGGYEPPAYTPPPAGGYEPQAPTPPPAGGYESQAPGGYGAQSPGGYEQTPAGGYDQAPAGGYGAQPGAYGQSAAGGYGDPAAGAYPPPGSFGQQPGYDPNVPGGYPVGPVPPAAAGALAEWPKRALGGLLDYVAAGIVIGVVSNLFSLINGSLGTIIQYLLIIAWWCYLGYKSGTTGVTFGRSIAKTKLISAETGAPVGVSTGIIRQFAHIIDSIICSVGWLFPLWDSQKQTLADKIMKTVVIDNSADPNAGNYSWQ